MARNCSRRSRATIFPFSGFRCCRYCRRCANKALCRHEHFSGSARIGGVCRLAGSAFAVAAVCTDSGCASMASTAPMCRSLLLAKLFTVAFAGLRAAGFAGVNITNPHKEAAFALADRVDEAARMAGAANLLVFRDGKIEARNTDIEGLAASLAEALGANSMQWSKHRDTRCRRRGAWCNTGSGQVGCCEKSASLREILPAPTR